MKTKLIAPETILPKPVFMKPADFLSDFRYILNKGFLKFLFGDMEHQQHFLYQRICGRVFEKRFQRIEAPAFYISNKRHDFLGNQIGQVREGAKENNQYDNERQERRDRFILYIFMDKSVDRIEQDRKDNGPHDGRQKGAYYLIRQVTKHQDNKSHDNKIEFIIGLHIYRDIPFNNSIVC